MYLCYKWSTLETYIVCFGLRRQRPAGVLSVPSLLAVASLVVTFWGLNKLKYFKSEYTEFLRNHIVLLPQH